MKSPVSYYQEKKSSTAAKGLGGAVGGFIIGVSIVAGILCVPAGFIGGGVAVGLLIAHAAPAAWGAWGTLAAVVGGMAAAEPACGIGILAGLMVAGIGSAVGAIAGLAVAGLTKGIGAGVERLAGFVGKKRRAAKAAKAAKAVQPVAAPAPAAEAVSAFKALDVKAQFVAATTAPVADNDNKAAPQAKPAAPKNAA